MQADVDFEGLGRTVRHAIAALVLDAMSTPFIAAFLALYAFAYLKVGAEVSFVPQARYAYAIGLVLAVIAAVHFIRDRRPRPAVQPS